MPRPTREEMEQQLVELLETASASEAERLAAGLRQRGIIAVANAEALPLTKARRGWQQPFRTFVLVHETDVDAASTVLDEILGAEGNIPDEQIRQEMLAAEQDPEAATAWFYENPARKDQLAAVIGKVVVVVAVGIVGWMVLQNLL